MAAGGDAAAVDPRRVAHVAGAACGDGARDAAPGCCADTAGLCAAAGSGDCDNANSGKPWSRARQSALLSRRGAR